MEIQAAITQASTEADVVHHFEHHLSNLLQNFFSVAYNPQKESAANRVRTSSKGRIDSRIGNVLIEFKRPTKLASSSQIRAARSQLESYLETLELQDEQVAVGYVTDGKQILRIELSAVDGSISSGTLQTMSARSLTDVVQDLLALERTRLTARSLVEAFSPSDGPLFTLARSFYLALSDTDLGRTRMLFAEWQMLFKLAHDDQSQMRAVTERRIALAKALGVTIEAGDNDAEYRALFAIQTAYAVVLKLIASHLLNGVRDSDSQPHFEDLITQSSSELQTFMSRLEAGDIFREEGFENLLEGDFFSWYADSRQWDSATFAGVQHLLRILARYENTPALRVLTGGVMDLFKDLYMAVIPEKVRHNLGEFYTPPWLADHTIESAKSHARGGGTWRGLDPCCGSGTFLTGMIRKVLQESGALSRDEQLHAVLHRVVGIDLNPLAVLTARINYFINIAHLIDDASVFEIPVYLGDASKIPERVDVDGIECIQYSIRTLINDLHVSLPASVVRDTDAFSRAMTEIEVETKLQNALEIESRITALCDDEDLNPRTRENIGSFAEALVELERQEWNGIWPRIIANFFTTANLGKFDIIVGNPPWIDWKNLPQNYRATLVELCIDRKLFSGAGRTGGINLNICALITHVAAHMWMRSDGALAFLMPEPLIFQKSYEGFRRFADTGEGALFLQSLVDWTAAGHPFYPVQQPFLTFVISKTRTNPWLGIPVTRMLRRKGGPASKRDPLRNLMHVDSFEQIKSEFHAAHRLAITPSRESTAFAYADTTEQAQQFQSLAGETEYRGRDGLQLYPENLFLFSYNGKLRNLDRQTASFLTFESANRSGTERIFETKFMRPVVKGTEIERFRWSGPNYYAPFPYEPEFASGRSPLNPGRLRAESPKVLAYYLEQKSRFGKQSAYNSRIIGERHNTEFYALTRVGEYSHAETFVAFRHNTKWAAVVVEAVSTPWGTNVSPVFQSHALSISEGPNGYISQDEAHFICGVFNSELVQRFIYQSSDLRSFKVQPGLVVPTFNAMDASHMAVSALSREAHKLADSGADLSSLDSRLDEAVVKLFGNLAA